MTTPPEQRRGSCLCGKVKYTISNEHGPDMTQLMCHCKNCLHSLGNSLPCLFVPIRNFQFPEDSMSYVKVYKDLETTSGKEMQRQFCSECGSCVLITVDANRDIAIVPVGTMECGGKGWFKPQVECFCSNKKEWMPEHEGTKTFDRMPVLG